MDTSEILTTFLEEIPNVKTIKWDYWANLSNIKPAQAARLTYQIDPNNWEGTAYCGQAPLPIVLHEKIARLESWLEGHSSSWSLIDLVPALTETVAPSEMVDAAGISTIDPKIQILCDYASFMQMEFDIQSVSEGLKKYLDHFTIAKLWAIAGGQRIRSDVWHYEELIEKAVCDGELIAEVSIWNPKTAGSYEVVPSSPTLLSRIKDGWISIDNEVDPENDTWLQYTIHRDNFRIWLEKSNKWPIADDCFLSKWFENDPEVKKYNEGISADKNKAGNKRKTKLNEWLRKKWDEWGKPNARDFAANLKPFANAFGSPVKKYHSWNHEVVVDWKSDWGGTSWGSRAFENKISGFRKEDKLAETKNLSRE